MSKFLIWLYGIYFFSSSFVLYCVAVVIWLLTAPFDPNRRALHYFACAWGHHYLLLSPFWHTEYLGKELIDPHKTYVLVSNHQSYFDILALYGLFKPFKWVSKEEIFNIPMVGWNMRLNEYVCIKRGNIRSIKEMLQTCKEWLVKGASVLIFPEGTRSLDGEMIEFRDGAFRLACETKLPVVPIVVDGTFQIFPKGAKVINFKHAVRVQILAPVDPSLYGYSSAKMRDGIHELMKRTLDEMRGRKTIGASSETSSGRSAPTATQS